jgi:hypothetical protein
MPAIVIRIDAVRSPETGKPLLLEIVETAETRDRPFTNGDGSWGSAPQTRSGSGWRVVDYSREKWTGWQRRRWLVGTDRRRDGDGVST